MLSLFGIVVAVYILNIELLLDLMYTFIKFKGIIFFCGSSFFIIQYFDIKMQRLQR
jgi:hypothetical protein